MRRENASLFSIAPLTLILLAANILMYVVSSIQSNNFMSMDSQVLENLGSSMRERLWDSQWLHLVAPMFLHVGLIHIIMNMHFLYSAGPDTELYFGSANYGTIYLLSGVCGMCLSQIFGGNRAVGASGCLCGIMGAHLAVKILQAPRPWQAWRSSDVRAVAFNLGLLLVIGILGVFRMDNWGHFGGMLGGVLLGFGFDLWMRRRSSGPALVLASVVFIGALVFSARYTFFNPTYHIFVGARATEELKDPPAAVASFNEAKKWAAIWKPLHVLGVLNERQVESILSYYRPGARDSNKDIPSWNLASARNSMLLVTLLFRRGRLVTGDDVE